MNPKHLEARWKNAVQKFTHLQELMDSGYVLRNGTGRCVNKIDIVNDHIIELIIEGHRDAYMWKDARCYRMSLTIQQFNADLIHWQKYPLGALSSAFTVSELMK